MVTEKAMELGQAIVESAEFKEYEEAKKNFEQNEEAVALLDEYTRKEERKPHKDDKGHDKGHHHGKGQYDLIKLIPEYAFQSPFKTRGLAFLLILIKARRIHQGLKTKVHGFSEGDDSPYQGKPEQRISPSQTYVCISFNIYILVRLSHGHGILVAVFHHDAFDNCLTAYSAVFHSNSTSTRGTEPKARSPVR